jgi:hypothetical protein
VRATSFPLLENEPLVIIRHSFLTLCDGDQAAAALLNNFVYWHDWCLQHGRHDQTASSADPDHKSIDPECWFWKTVEDLSRDLLGGWGEKKIRAAVALIEAKGFAISRPNPINPWDRTKQYRLVVENLHSALSALVAPDADEPGERTDGPLVPAKAPARSGKNAGWAKSTSYGDSPIRQNDRMHSARMPSLQPEITKSEITPTSSSSAETPASSTPRTPQMTNETVDPANADANAETHEQPVCEGDNPLASVPLHWAQTRGIRKRNPNGCIGFPSPDFAAEWAKTAHLSGIRTSDELCAVLDHALSEANEISNKSGMGWEWWSYLTFRVEAAARLLAPRLPYWRAEPEASAPAALFGAKADSAESARPRPAMALDSKAFLAWWRRLPEDRRLRYGGVCSPVAFSDFTRSYQPIRNLTGSETSAISGASACSVAPEEANAAPGDTLRRNQVSSSHGPSAAAKEEFSLPSHSQKGRCATQDEASHACRRQTSQLDTPVEFRLASDAHLCERGN